MKQQLDQLVAGSDWNMSCFAITQCTWSRPGHVVALAITVLAQAVGMGAGNFTALTVSATADGAHSTLATDVDGDGRVDALSASPYDDRIVWYKNEGGSPPTWTPYTISSTADFAAWVYATDVDGDGLVDALSASYSDNKIAWYKNLGGSPPAWKPYTIAIAAGAESVYAVDVDGDGRVDVMSASLLDNKVAWYKNGGGSPPIWTAYTISGAASGAHSVYASDIDGDGRIDVVSGSMYDNKIAWYKNGGGSPPTWTAYTISTSAAYAICVRATDVDGDGRVDVLSASSGDNKIAWYRNQGGSPVSWTAYTISSVAAYAWCVYAADVDGDGRVDVLSASVNDNKIAWYKNGGGSPPTWTAYTISSSAPGATSVYTADVNGDGAVDVLSSSYVDDKIALYLNNMCPRGSFGPSGFAPCTPCPPGRFGNNSVQASCIPCDAGRYGTAVGAFNATAGCSGVCAAGYACPAGSTNATAVACSVGQYSLGGAGACINCSAGLYGATNALSTAACSGPCPAGTFGNTSGLATSSCSGNCSAGHACPTGSLNSTAVLCPAGQFSEGGAGVCSNCSAGLYGATMGLRTAACSSPCPAGRYGSTLGLTTPNCTGLCDAGSYGARAGLARSSCTGPCSAGYACPSGSVVDTAVTCPAGTYSTGGAGSCSPCAPGKYSADSARPVACDADCIPGSYCPPGTAMPLSCPAGRYGSEPALASAACTETCPVGSYCVTGAVTPALCPPGVNSPRGPWVAL
jgi:hypothetical protein